MMHENIAKRFLAVLSLLLFLLAGTAQARIVAILYDDSGSMKGKDSLPAFGAQLLVSTLDGRQGHDRLLTARMSDVGAGESSIHLQNIRTSQAQRQLIGQIRATWHYTNSETPHEQILWLLRRMVNMQKKNEEAFLVILTDGIFSDPPNPAAFRKELIQLRQRLKGPLQVMFLLMGPDLRTQETGNLTIGDIVEQQGVRRALLEVFNGDANSGRFDVSSAADLANAFRHIIARIASTEITSIEKYVRRAGGRIEIDSPLSIRRIISVAIGRVGEQLPRPVTDSLPAQHIFSLSARMDRSDTRGGWQGERLSAETTHFLFDPPLQAGRHVLQYDGPTDNVLLLFETDVRLDMDIVDARGSTYPKDGAGVVRIPLDGKSFLRMRVRDNDGKGRYHVVPLSIFRTEQEFKARLTWDAGGDLFLSPRKRRKDVLFRFPADRQGSGIVEGQMLVRGFVRALAPPLRFAVVNNKAALGIDARPVEKCDDCAPGEIRFTLVPSKKAWPVAKVKVHARAPVANGRLTVAVENGEGLLRLMTRDGRSPAKPVSLRRGENTLEFLLVAGGDLKRLRKFKERGIPVRLRARAEGALAGESAMQVLVRPHLAQARLVITGNTMSADGKRPLQLDMAALHRGGEGIRFHLYNAYEKAKAEQFHVTSGSKVLDFVMPVEVDTNGEQGLLRLRSRTLCGCFLPFFSGERRLRVTWRDDAGLQKAETIAPLTLNVPFLWQGAWECLKLLLSILAAVYLFIAFVMWARARTFPRGSGIVVYHETKRSPSRKDGPDRRIFFPSSWRNWTWLKALLWPVFGVPHQEFYAEGLHLRARGGGLSVDLTRSDKAVRLASLGQTIGEILEERQGPDGRPPKKSIHEPLSWDDEYEVDEGHEVRRGIFREKLAGV